jgi:hypothetical protein
MTDRLAARRRLLQSAEKAREFLGRHRRVLSWLILATAPALVFYWAFCALLAHLYNGGYLLDAGFLSELIWRNLDQSSLHSPTRSSYYTIHITPFHSLLSGLSYAVPWNRAGYFSAYVAAITAFAVGIVVNALHTRDSTLLDDFLSAGVGVLFGLSAMLLGPILYPHYEQIMPLAAAAFAYCLLADKAPRARWLFFALAVLTREDGGLHTFLLFAVLIAAKRLGVTIAPSYRNLLIPFVTAGATSAAMILIQKFSPLNAFSAFDSSFSTNPVTTLLSMSGEAFEQRLRLLLFERTYVWAPFAVSIFCALAFRDAGYALGYVSNVPWFLLLFASKAGPAAHFSLYYHFPFLIGALWPILWANLRGTARAPALCIALAVSLGALKPSDVAQLWAANITAARISATEHFMELIGPRLTRVDSGIVADSAFTALMPDSVIPEQILRDDTDASKAWALIFSGCYPLDRGRVLSFLDRSQWKALARVKGTQYYLATRSRSAVKRWNLPLEWLTYRSYGDAIRCHRD